MTPQSLQPTSGGGSVDIRGERPKDGRAVIVRLQPSPQGVEDIQSPVRQVCAVRPAQFGELPAVDGGAGGIGGAKRKDGEGFFRITATVPQASGKSGLDEGGV